MSDKYAKNIIDKTLQVTRALPATDEAVTSADIDLKTPLEAAFGLVELLIDLPALTPTEFPNADTLDIVVQHGSSAGPTDLLATVPTITGADATRLGGRYRVALPSKTLRYVNVKITAAGGVGDMSGKSATISLAT